jgi:hypothetical protein
LIPIVARFDNGGGFAQAPHYNSENIAPAGRSTLKFGVKNSSVMAVDPSLLIGHAVDPNLDIQYSDHHKLSLAEVGVQNRPISWY